MNYLLLNLIIALYINAIGSLLIAIFVLAKNWKNWINRSFGLFSFAIIWWSFCEAQSLTANTIEKRDLFYRLLHVGVWMIPMAWTHFVILFLKLKNREWIYKLGYSLAVVSIVFSFSHYLTDRFEEKFFLGLWGVAGPLYYVFNIIFVVFVAYTFYELFKAYKNNKGILKNQILYLILSVFLGFIGGPSNFFYSYDIYIPYYQPFSTYTVILFPLGIAYAILKHQLLDIRVVVKKTLIYSLGIALISGFIVSISFLSSWFENNIPGFNYWLVPFAAGLVSFIIGRIFWNKSKEVEKLKYEFITVAAHKLRTPLTEIKWGAEALSDKENDPEKRRLIYSVQKANERLIELTNELLLVSKAESGQGDYKFEKINLEKTARSVINDFQHQIREKGIKLDYKFERNLPMVLADRIRISSVIQMLLENAIQYTKNKIDVSIDTYKDNVIFHIEDNGIGIKKEDLNYIFSRFYRSHEAYITETEGTGIGLFLAKSIIDNHHGKIGVKSEGGGKGSVFWFGLKAVK